MFLQICFVKVFVGNMALFFVCLPTYLHVPHMERSRGQQNRICIVGLDDIRLYDISCPELYKETYQCVTTILECLSLYMYFNIVGFTVQDSHVFHEGIPYLITPHRD